jgi:hypothetical protein
MGDISSTINHAVESQKPNLLIPFALGCVQKYAAIARFFRTQI